MELRTNETISVTDIQRRAKEVFERIERGDQDKYVVLKNNEITAVLLPADRYEALMDELEDLRIDAIAAERVLTFDPAKAITHEDMLARFGVDDLVEQ
ncbi:MAG: type II toxin-antitoxin system prevent-host-death family antitoxin [Rhodocyclaceae bacterium]|nr:type II toxin-antitoxin system prevent-host-death family antitoxin [Rhodocyclaceae bacterium]